jgi:hypothetical protein
MLPSAKSFWGAAWLSLKSLFISPAFDPDRMKMLTNAQWTIEQHEWEYSVTIIPLLIIVYGGLKILRQLQIKECILKSNWKQYLQIAAIAALLILPLAVNTYSPAWNAFLKKIPLIKSASSLIRWFIIYIPVVIITTTLIFEKITISTKYQMITVIISLTAVVAINAVTDRNHYLKRNYDPKEIVRSYYQVKAGLLAPNIKAIGINVDEKGQLQLLIKRNNMLVYGASQLYCYEALFGYRLEDFPVKTLHPGPVLEEKGGVLNIKNPSCYVWPAANHCQPGDHFTVQQKEAAEAFVNYRPFAFQMPAIQQAANWINALALITALVFLLLYAAKALYHHRRKTDNSR